MTLDTYSFNIIQLSFILPDEKKMNSRQHPMDDVKNLQNGNHLAKTIISA